MMTLYAFDGTWQEEEEEAGFGNSNIARCADAYDGPVCYYRGIGTKGGKILRLVNGGTGFGGEFRIHDAKEDLKRQLRAGERAVDIVGFSRGAALAIDFANEIVDTLRRNHLRVRFLGLFDTVHSFGVAGIDFNLFHKPQVPDIVDRCYHALALDERRRTFPCTRTPNGYEVWFRGAHSDIGGGNDNAPLNCIALRWMLCKARAAGMPIKAGAIDALGATINGDAPIMPPGFDPKADPFRVVGSDDRVHYSVKPRPNHNNPRPNARIVTEVAEQSLGL
jgi:uncharacterized protein (DUF2235 family)